ncbi:unnamed protein product [Lymnaea stagnalis]|uniref:NXPE C-terminal domain-containing protein n=1 Tax=Lymnaea stagnalis TaxID=6523 RepID=A0AAV2HPI0_LYMST
MRAREQRLYSLVIATFVVLTLFLYRYHDTFHFHITSTPSDFQGVYEFKPPFLSRNISYTVVWPSLAGTGITQAEIEDKFNRCTKVSVSRYDECRHVHARSSSYWRSVSKGSWTADEDFKRMNLASECCAFNHTELMAPAPRSELYPWEREYLSLPPLYNLSDIASADRSVIDLLTDTSDGSLTMGSDVQFKILLFNGRGERKTSGGDSVWVWLVSNELGASIAADVVDNKDGSYTASTILPWSGRVQVKATISHHRELFRINLYIQRLFTTSHWFTAKFKNNAGSETTPCSPLPFLPGFPEPEVCNLTDVNGFPWFCGKPVKKDLLNCSDFVSSKKLNSPGYYPLTEAEEELILMSETKRPFMIPNNIAISVLPAQNDTQLIPQPELPCSKRNLSFTFEDINSSGFFYNKTWRSLACQLPQVDREFLRTCLNNTQMIIIGDSNSIRQMDIITKMVGCTEKIKKTQVTWHAPWWCDVDSLGLSIKYYPPKMPFYGSMGEDLPNHVLYSSVSQLDAIPADGKYLVHLHHLLHLVPFHLSIAEHRLRLIRKAIERLMARNPHVVLVYQSAFTSFDKGIKNKPKISYFLLKLQREIFRDLGDRVMFMFTWPMTIAAENSDRHPTIANKFTKFYMGHVCGRW